MPHIDLYSIYQLDRRQPPEVLAAQLTTQLNSTDPRDQLTRNRIDTARAILGDPVRRARYDRALADPAAPTLDEAALAAIAGRPAPTTNTARTGLATAFAGKQVRILSAITAALALVLVVGITAAACSGGDDPSPTAAPSNQSGQSGQTSYHVSDCSPRPNTGTDHAAWDRNRPAYTLVLKKSTPLPAQFAAYADPNLTGGQLIVQYQDRNIGVVRTESDGFINSTGGHTTVATFAPAGALISTKEYAKGGDQPRPFDLMKTSYSGYFRISAVDGVTIPAAAAGDKAMRNYAITVRPDAFDETAVWVLLRGGSALYKAQVFFNETDDPCQIN